MESKSNREKEAVSPVGEGVHHPPVLALGAGSYSLEMRGSSTPQNSNREALRLEIDVTHTK